MIPYLYLLVYATALPFAHSFQTRASRTTRATSTTPHGTATNDPTTPFHPFRLLALPLPLPRPLSLPNLSSSPAASWTKFIPFYEYDEDENERRALEDGAKFLKSLGLEYYDDDSTDSTMTPGQILDLASASLPSLLRLGSGVFAEGYRLSLLPQNTTDSTPPAFTIGNYQIRETSTPTTTRTITTRRTTKPPIPPIILYDHEPCPSCRRVREAVSTLGLTVEYRPCPTNGSIRRRLEDRCGGRINLPHMTDPATGVELRGADEITAYLFRFYSGGRVVPRLLEGADLAVGIALLVRGGRGGERRFSNPPERPLVVWGYEGCPGCKVVREELCELEIVHRWVSCPRGGENWRRLFERFSGDGGWGEVPYLEDLNKGG